MARFNLYKDKYLSHNFITYSWMNILCKDLNVSGGARDLFALVFSFTKDGKHKFNATQKYISEMIYCSISSVKRYTKELSDAGLIYKDYALKNDSTRVEISINEDILVEYFGCGLHDLYRLSKDVETRVIPILFEDLEETSDNEHSDETEDNSKAIEKNSPEQIIMDFTVSRKNGFLKSKERPAPRETKARKENKFNQFVEHLRHMNYPDSVISSGEKYIKWLLGNRKVEFAQWQQMIAILNSELKRIPNKAIREQAAIDAFDSAFAGGFRKLNVDRYKYGKDMTSQPQKSDTQVSDSKIEQIDDGVYKVVSAEPIEFVKNTDGSIMTF